MDRITISMEHGCRGTCVNISILPDLSLGDGNKPIYEGTMTFEEFGKCVAGIAYCDIKSWSHK